MVKVGLAVGRCGNCDKEIARQRPADYAVCDCYEYCPNDHGNGPYGTHMQPYTPDLTPSSYEPGDMDVVRICTHHTPPFKSKLRPVEVRLS